MFGAILIVPYICRLPGLLTHRPAHLSYPYLQHGTGNVLHCGQAGTSSRRWDARTQHRPHASPPPCVPPITPLPSNRFLSPPLRRTAIGEVLLSELVSMLTSPDQDDPNATAPALTHRPATPRAPTTPRGLSARDPSSPGLPGRSALRSSWTPSLHSGGAGQGAGTPRGLSRASLSAWQLAEGAHYHQYQGAGESHPGAGEPLALRAQLGAARDACQHVTKHLKNVEGLLRAMRVSGGGKGAQHAFARYMPRALRRVNVFAL